MGDARFLYECDAKILGLMMFLQGFAERSKGMRIVRLCANYLFLLFELLLRGLG